MFNPIITPSQTAVILADGSASKIGATIGTTTTAISMKSKKKPSTKITIITIANFAQKPPGNEFRKSRTKSSPPNARNAAVSIAAPKRMMKTRDVVFAVSVITLCKMLSRRKTRSPLQTNAVIRAKEAINPIMIPVELPPLTIIAFTFIS